MSTFTMTRHLEGNNHFETYHSNAYKRRQKYAMKKAVISGDLDEVRKQIAKNFKTFQINFDLLVARAESKETKDYLFEIRNHSQNNRGADLSRTEDV